MAKQQKKPQKKKQKNQPAPESSILRPDQVALILAGVVSLLVVYAGFESGNWRGVLITEVQVLAVAAAAWVGLRA